MDRLIATAVIVSLAIILPSIAHTKPVIRPDENAWEDLVGIRYKGHNLEIWVIKDHKRPCDPKATDFLAKKYKVRVKYLRGREAAKWLAGRNRELMRRLSNGRYKFNKINLNQWRMVKNNGGLYWQKLCAGISRCGDMTPDSYRRKRLDWLTKLRKTRWDKTKVGASKKYTYDKLCNFIISPTYSSKHYEGNVKIWEKQVMCFDGCIMATPKNFQVNNQAIRTYESCIDRCNKIKYMKCP